MTFLKIDPLNDDEVQQFRRNLTVLFGGQEPEPRPKSVRRTGCKAFSYQFSNDVGKVQLIIYSYTEGTDRTPHMMIKCFGGAKKSFNLSIMDKSVLAIASTKVEGFMSPQALRMAQGAAA